MSICLQNPPNLSLAKIQQYQSPWGLFLDCEQANLVEFQPTDDFQPVRLLFDEDTPQQREVDGWLTQRIRLAIIHRSAGIEVQQKTDKGWRYMGQAYHQGEITAAGLMAANNRETYRLWTRYLLLFLDDSNQPLPQNPLQLGMSSGTGGSFGEELKVFCQEIERVFFKLRQQSQKSLSDRAHALTVLDCQLGLHKNDKAPFVCPARRGSPAIDQVGVSKEVERRQGRRITLVGVPIQSLLIPKSVERNHHNPTDIDDRPGATPPLLFSVNPNSLLAAFIANLDCLSEAELKALGQAIAATESRKAVALVKGMAASADLAAAAIAVLSGNLPRT